jgi:methane monooxygenase PmoA-like
MKTILLTLVCALAVAARVSADPTPVKVTTLDNHLHVDINGSPFTDYWFGKRDDRPYVRPFFLPVLAADGTPVTSDQYTVPKGDPKSDHPHHQSMWVAESSVNGVDHWIVTARPQAKQEHLKFEKVTDDGFVEDLQWDDGKGGMLLTETRTVQFFGYDDGARAMDLTVALAPVKDAVTLGDAKDAGLCAVRVAHGITDTVTITNSAGQTTEKQCWGKPADWCDESGTIDGKPYGIAIFDAPTNPRYPARWHVREYGLMSANPFGLHDFEPKVFPKGAGDFKIEPGTTASFHYRVIIHTGNVAAAGLDEKYKKFAAEFPAK